MFVEVHFNWRRHKTTNRTPAQHAVLPTQLLNAYGYEDVKAELLPEYTGVEKVVPKRQKFRELITATNTGVKAVENDPLEHYLYDTPDKRDTKLWRRAHWFLQFLVEFRATAQRQAWSVNHGQSIMIGHTAPNDPENKPTVRDKLVDALLSVLFKVLEQADTKEQRKRAQRFDDIMSKVFEEVLGDRKSEMLAISGLATLPECQGRGYASALVRVVTALADEQGRAVWLGSSNIANLGFYNSLGFVTVRRMMVGADDPTWDEPPVPVDLMVREPRSFVRLDKSAWDSAQFV